jgi:hypothetical protein
LILLAVCYGVPVGILSILAALRILDPWPRYYFLFYPALVIALLGLVFCLCPPKLSLGLSGGLAMVAFAGYTPTGGIPSSRLNTSWLDFPQARGDLLDRVGARDLVLSRSSLVEANDPEFLHDPLGLSYLKCFLEAEQGPLPARHIPLPFSPENRETREYLAAVVQDAARRHDQIWLVNVGPLDFDYRIWLRDHWGSRFELAEERVYSSLVLCRYIRREPNDQAIGPVIEPTGRSHGVHGHATTAQRHP